MSITARSLIFALLLASPLTAAPKDVADHFPADAVLYVEVNQPGAVAKDLGAFLKGTVFENALPALDKIREKQLPEAHFDRSAPGLLSTLLGPEMLKEVPRFQGLALAVTGFDKQGDPEFLAVVLPGESQLPGFAMRAYLSSHPSLRKIATTEGVDLYQESMTQFVDDPLVAPNNGEPARQVRDFGPFYAYREGLLAIGSRKELVSAAIQKHLGKDTSAALASAPSFKPLLLVREKPGILVHGDVRRLFEHLAIRAKQGKELEPFFTVALRKMLPNDRVRTFTARLEITAQGMRLEGALALVPQASAPLAELLTGPALATDDLHRVPQNASLAFALNLPEGPPRLPRLLGIGDAFVHAAGGLGPNASELIKELEEKKILSSADVEKIQQVLVVLPPAITWPKGVMPAPTLLFRTTTPEAAETLLAAIPAILEAIGSEKPELIAETIEGVKVQTIGAKASRLGVPFHFARHGRDLALGTDRQFLALCLKADPAKSVASLKDVSEHLKSAENSALVGTWRWPEIMHPPKTDASGGFWKPFTQPVYDGPSELSLRILGQPYMTLREIVVPLVEMPPLFVSLARQGDELRFVFDQRDPTKARVKLFQRYLEFLSYVGVVPPWARGQSYDEPPLLVPGLRGQ